MNESSTQDKNPPLASLRNHFLIAMPSLNESIFSHTITYLCDHSSAGAMGLVINQPLGIELVHIYRQLDCDPGGHAATSAVLCGGPVQPERGFILHTADRQWETSLTVTDDVMLTASRDIVESICQGNGPEKFLVALGYAGWGAGQLEDEIASNSWLTLPADSAILFDTAVEQRWAAASKSLGIDLNLISGTAGHA